MIPAKIVRTDSRSDNNYWQERSLLQWSDFVVVFSKPMKAVLFFFIVLSFFFFFLSNILSEPKLGGRIQIQVIDVRHEIDQIDGGHTIFSCLMHILYISRIPFLILQPWNTRIRICIYIYRQNILLQEPTSHTHYTPNTPTHTELRVVFL